MRNKLLTTRNVMLAVFSAMLALCLTFGIILLSGRADATDNVSVWTGDLAKAGWGGAGEMPEEYVLSADGKTLEIGSADALAYFSHEVYADADHALDGVTVKLACDIDLGGDKNIWVPIGTTKRSSNPAIRFSGVFDGQGYTISNFSSKGFYDKIRYDATYTEAEGYYVDGGNGLKIPFNNDKGEYTYGLFGVTADITVKNLTVRGVNFNFPDFTLNGSDRTFIADNVGAIIGHNEGSLLVEKCVAGGLNDDKSSDSTIYVATAGNPAIGGVVGRAYGRKQADSATQTDYESIKVESSVSYVNIDYTPNYRNDGQYGKASGILGFANNFKDCEITYCKNYGNITGAQFAGGIVGYVSDNTKTVQYSNDEDRQANAWNFIINNCENYGNMTAANVGFDEFKYENSNGNTIGPNTYAGGIVAHLGTSNQNCASAFEGVTVNEGGEEIEYYGKLAPVNFYVTNCNNYGEIRAINTANRSINGEGKVSAYGYNIGGGVIGMLTPSETGETRITDNYNYGDIYGEIGKDNNFYTPRLGGLVGYQYYSWLGDNSTTRYIDFVISGGSSGKVYGDTSAGDGGYVHSLIGYNSHPKKSIESVNLIDAGGVIDIVTEDKANFSSGAGVYKPNAVSVATNEFIYDQNNGTVIKGLVYSETAEEKDIEIEIPATVTAIADGAFANVGKLVKVTFAAGSQLETIGGWAFAGTGITNVVIPANVASIGAGAFANCGNLVSVSFESEKVSKIGEGAFANCINLNYVELPANAAEIEYGSYVFDKNNGNVYLIAKNKQSYDAIMSNENVSPVLSAYDVTFIVNISYYLNDLKLASEDRLFGADYSVKFLEDRWTSQETTAIGPGSVSGMRWYYDSKLIADVNALTDLLRASGTGENVDLYSFAEYGWHFAGRNDIVFDENKSYSTSELNDLLSADSDKIAKGMNPVIIGYTDTKGNVCEVANLPSEIHNAGTYLVQIQIGENDEDWREVAIEVKQQTLDLGDYNSLSWRVDGSGAELREMALYIYQKGGREYPSNSILSDVQINELGLDSDNYVTRIVLYSAVRYNGTPISIFVKDNPAFEVEYPSNQLPSATAAGKYEAKAYLTISDNYTVVNSSASAFRGMTIRELASGEMEVTKVWYVVNTSNYLVNANGDYTINNFVYGNNPAQNANDLIPQLRYTNDDPSHSFMFNLELQFNGVKVGNTFKPEEIGNYINSTMPAGNYILIVTVGGVYSYDEEADPDGEEERELIYHAGFTESHSFTVEKKGLQSLTAFNSAINKKTFIYKWDDGKSHFYEQSKEVADAYNAFVDKFFNPTKQGIWADAAYSQYYGNPVVEFNLDRMQSSEYYGAELVNTGDADTYKVYYKISALNYYDSIERLSANDSRTNYYFTVINVREIALPSIEHQTYNGSVLKAVVDIPKDVNGEPLYYTVLTNEGGTGAGTYDVVLKLNDSEHYMWAGQTVEGKTETYTVKFEIDKCPDNYFTTTLGITTWVTGKYDKLEEFPVVVGACYGSVVVKLAYANDLEKVIYEGANNTEEFAAALSELKAGSYILTATVADSDDYNGILNVITFSVFDKDGLPWWAVLLIVVGALGVAALVLFILHEKGILQMLTGRVVIAMRTKATVDATIAAVRANKVAAEAKKTVAKAEAKDRMEALRAAQAEAKNMTAEEQAAALEEKAVAAAKSAERMQKRADSMQKKAEKMKQKAEKQNEAAEAEQTVVSEEERPADEN